MLHVVTSIALPLILCIIAVHPTILRWEEHLIAPRLIDGAYAASWGRIAPPPLDLHGDAAVVLGYALERNGSLTPALKARVQAGVALYVNHSVPVLVFSGGHPGGGVRVRSEAAAMDAYGRTLLPGGVVPPDPHTQWLLEELSTSTWENALYSWGILRHQQACRIIVTTNPFHQLRSLLTFRCAAKHLDIPCAEVLLAYVPPHEYVEHASVVQRAFVQGALQAALLGASAGLIAGVCLVTSSRYLWRLVSVKEYENRSTTSSAGGGTAAYETAKAVDEYLQFHFAPADELLPYKHAPKDACNFPARCAHLCERHCLALQDFTGELGAPTALDIGCAVGGATFELARSFPLVVGVDYSQHFVDAASAMQATGRMPYTTLVEGSITTQSQAIIDPAIDRTRVRFVRGDACNLPNNMRPVDCVLAANLLCRLPQPEKFLHDLPRLLKPGGIAVLVSPYSWLPAWTPLHKWLGGYYDATSKQPVWSFDTLRGVMEGQGFKLVAEEDMPFLIREHVRKYQWGCSHATVWRRCS